MNQAQPKFEEFKGSRKNLAKSLGLEESDIDDSLPIIYGSTGTWTLLVPIKKLQAFSKMKPNNKEFPTILKEMPKASVHPFCIETYDDNANMHARHFSSPYSGTIEDAVTGTASGVMGAFYAKYINMNVKAPLNLIVEQGQEITENNRKLDIRITGNAVYVKDFEVELQT